MVTALVLKNLSYYAAVETLPCPIFFSPFGLNLFKRDDVFGSEGVRVLEDCCRCREDWASILVGKVVFILSQQSQEFDPIES